MLLTELVKIKIVGRTLKRYRELGYKCNIGDEIMVKVSDLPRSSHIKVQCLCDYCQDKIIEKTYDKYNRARKIIEKDCCPECANMKNQENFQKINGVKAPLQLDKIKDKTKNTCLLKYNVDNPMKNKDVQNKLKQSNQEKYGYEYPLQDKTIRKKAQDTLYQNYGVMNPFENGEIREKSYYKTLRTKSINKTIPVSKAQLYLSNLYQVPYNQILCTYYAVDLLFEENKVYCEYDGGGHNLKVVLGQTSQEEFDKQEKKRYYILKRSGYKVFRIINMKSKEKLPSDEILLQIKLIALQYLMKEKNNYYIKFDIDNHQIKTKNNIYNWDYKELFDERIEII